MRCAICRATGCWSHRKWMGRRRHSSRGLHARAISWRKWLVLGGIDATSIRAVPSACPHCGYATAAAAADRNSAPHTATTATTTLPL